jgi:hypothetical protein
VRTISPAACPTAATRRHRAAAHRAAACALSARHGAEGGGGERRCADAAQRTPDDGHNCSARPLVRAWPRGGLRRRVRCTPCWQQRRHDEAARRSACSGVGPRSVCGHTALCHARRSSLASCAPAWMPPRSPPACCACGGRSPARDDTSGSRMVRVHALICPGLEVGFEPHDTLSRLEPAPHLFPVWLQAYPSRCTGRRVRMRGGPTSCGAPAQTRRCRVFSGLRVRCLGVSAAPLGPGACAPHRRAGRCSRRGHARAKARLARARCNIQVTHVSVARSRTHCLCCALLWRLACCRLF